MFNLNYTTKQKIQFILLFLAVIVSAWLLVKTSDDMSEKNSEAPVHHLDAFAKEVIAFRFNDVGKLVNELHVANLKHFNDDSSEFEKPLLMLYSDDQKPWEIKADKGHATEGISQIELWDNVRLHQDGSSNRREMTINTTRAKVYPEKDYAETDQPVDLVQPGVTIKSVGVKTHFKKGRVELLSNAKGQYEPSAQS